MKLPGDKQKVVVENRNSIISYNPVPPQRKRPRSMMAKSDLLTVGLASWVVQDGNYGDFARGKRAAFALEFFALESLLPIEAPSAEKPSLIPRLLDHDR